MRRRPVREESIQIRINYGKRTSQSQSCQNFTCVLPFTSIFLPQLSIYCQVNLVIEREMKLTGVNQSKKIS